MAGSRAWFNYVSDNGITYAIELDENLGLLEGAGFTAYTGGTLRTLLPQGMKPRYVNAVQVDGDGGGFKSRQFPMGTAEAALYLGTASTFLYNGFQYAVSSKRGEQARLPKALPTGLTGDSQLVGESSSG